MITSNGDVPVPSATMCPGAAPVPDHTIPLHTVQPKEQA
jgi:hypothetical protein